MMVHDIYPGPESGIPGTGKLGLVNNDILTANDSVHGYQSFGRMNQPKI